MQFNTGYLFRQSGIAFGTSGARGLVSDFTDEMCAAFTIAFLNVMRKSFSFTHIALAIDRRPSSPQIAKACIAAVQAEGYEVIYCGRIPTPALAYQAMLAKMPSIMVTGSHIPFDRNGLKFYRPDGEITKKDEDEILQVNKNFNVPKLHELPLISFNAQQSYFNRYINFFPTKFLAGKRIGLYEHSSVGRELNKQILENFGAEVISLEPSEEFVPIDTEAVSEKDRIKALEWTQNYKFDAIFSTDGDGDRPLIATETGEWLRGDIVGLLCAQYLKIEALAVPISCNTAIEQSQHFKQVLRTRIGSPYVIDGMLQLRSTCRTVAGFEANGGFLLGIDVKHESGLLRALPTRDAILPLLAILALSTEQVKPISNLLHTLPKRYTASNRLTNFSIELSKKLLSIWTNNPSKLFSILEIKSNLLDVNTMDGLRITLDNEIIIHIRPSGNAPELRLYIEASEKNVAENKLSIYLDKLNMLKN